MEEVEPWEAFMPRFQSTPRRQSLVPIRCTVADIEMSQRSTELNCSDAEELDEGKGFMGVGGTPADMVGSSVGSEANWSVCQRSRKWSPERPSAPGTREPQAPAVRCVVGDHELSRRSSQGTVYNPEPPTDVNVQTAVAETVTCSVANQTEETHSGVVISDEAPGTMNTTPFCAITQGAVFGAPIQTQEQSMQLPYPIDDLARIHPEIFADPHDLAAMITLYVECLPTRLVEGMDNLRSNRPDRRTPLVILELTRYKVDIAALSETKSSERGQLEGEEEGAGYTFFWTGCLGQSDGTRASPLPSGMT
nr:unnamed protein product [Spirometra erinaceieuropaei]